MLDAKPLSADPSDWRCEDVAVWLRKIGMAKYADLIAIKHKVRFSFAQKFDLSEKYSKILN